MSRAKPPRGYLLMEAMVGSAVLAVALTAVYQFLGQADLKAQEDVRRGQANAALMEGIAKIRAIDFGNLPASCTTTAPCEDPASNGVQVTGTVPDTVRRSISISTPVATSPCPTPCRLVTVTVKYRSATRQWRTVQAKTFIVNE